MAEYEEEQLHNILRLTEDSVRALSAVWKRTFDETYNQDNFRRLNSHASAFYNDLIKESLQKESLIKDEINELREEAENLQRLLNTEIELPAIVAENNVPLLDIQLKLDKSLEDLRAQLRRRREQICELLLEQESLCDELGEPPRELLADPLPTASEIDIFRDYLDWLKQERENRTQRLHALRREIKNCLKILQQGVNTNFDDRLLNQRLIQLSKETFDALEKLRQRYTDQVEDLTARIDSMREKLPPLWNRLNTPMEDREKILRYTEYEQVTADILYQELSRCEELKRQNIKQYIKKIRAEIEHWWNLTLKSEKERQRFAHYYSNFYCDELLTFHELELDELKRQYQTYEQIFALYADRNVLWERMTALEQKANDPARYNNRGGQLLREEKERKTIATKLPKIEQQIKELVQAYTEREHTPFLVYGEDILEVMKSDWEKKRQEKEAHTNARKNAVTPQNSTNRSHVSSARTPLLQRNASASILRKTPSNTNLSSSKHSNLGAGGSALKRKLPPSEKTTPTAKRSLWKNTPDAFKKPTTTSTSASKLSALKVAQKKKMPRVLATTIRRRSSLNANGSLVPKRRSMNKSGRGSVNVPKIVITPQTSSNEDEENYDLFKNSISPDSRSSIRHESTVIDKLTEAKKRRQKQKMAAIQEQQRLGTLPKPTKAMLTPSKKSSREYPVSPGASTSTCSSRKLTTKNLPILI